MNSFRHLRKSINAAAACAVLLSTVAVLPASAQEAAPLNAVEMRNGQEAENQRRVVAPEMPSVALPEDASLGEANARVKALASEADEGLDRLVEGALSSEQGKTAVSDWAASNDRIMLLDSKVREAELAVKYWETVKGKDHRAEEKIKDLETVNADMDKELKALREQVSRAVTEKKSVAVDPDPVVAEITGAAGTMRAKVLIPYMGEVMASRGDTLPNGQKITKISAQGVTVIRIDGSSALLGFGNTVAKTRPLSAGAGLAATLSR